MNSKPLNQDVETKPAKHNSPRDLRTNTTRSRSPSHGTAGGDMRRPIDRAAKALGARPKPLPRVAKGDQTRPTQRAAAKAADAAADVEANTTPNTDKENSR